MANTKKTYKTVAPTNFYRDYRIKVYGNGYNQLAGLPLLMDIFGDILLNKILEKAEHTLLDKVELKFRRGIKVTIYVR